MPAATAKDALLANERNAQQKDIRVSLSATCAPRSSPSRC
jgi:hypothetical protein